MKKLWVIVLFMAIYSSPALAVEEGYVHPIDTQEAVCKAAATNLQENATCTMKATNMWSREVDKYYSLLHKKLTNEAKTAMYDNQKYWNMQKNNEFTVIDALYEKDLETEGRLLLRVSQKRDIVKHRAQILHSYYIQTFPVTDDDAEKIPVNSIYKPDNFFQRLLRHLSK